jgi:hypothetical protein
LTDVNRVLGKAPTVRFPVTDTALVAAEFMMPELALLPPFECPS